MRGSRDGDAQHYDKFVFCRGFAGFRRFDGCSARCRPRDHDAADLRAAAEALDAASNVAADDEPVPPSMSFAATEFTPPIPAFFLARS